MPGGLFLTLPKRVLSPPPPLWLYTCPQLATTRRGKKCMLYEICKG